MSRRRQPETEEADLTAAPPWLRSYKVRLGAIILAVVTATAVLTWLSAHAQVAPWVSLPIVIAAALVLTQLLARGMTSPLRRMTRAARAMAAGDYSQRIHLSPPRHDEVGQLAEAFSRMAATIERNDQRSRDLVANVSHELRTPVAGLRGQLENMADGVTPATPQALQEALADTERLSRLVEHLLDLSRLEADVTQLHREEFAAASFLERVSRGAAVAAQARHRDVHWRIDVRPEDLRMRADPARLQQVVANLLDNASRHSPAGGTVTVSARPRPGGGVRVEVSDEGPGIPLKDRERVFERFQRGQDATPGTGGTGLGLAIARWAVEQHGGSLTVVMDPDRSSPGALGDGSSSRLRIDLPG